jgi:hypothetical protein
MTNDNDPLDPYLNDITQGMAEYLTMRRTLLIAEQKLEHLLSEDLVEILTDPEGNFTYRITNKGVKLFSEKFGATPATNDITFLQFAGINS